LKNKERFLCIHELIITINENMEMLRLKLQKLESSAGDKLREETVSNISLGMAIIDTTYALFYLKNAQDSLNKLIEEQRQNNASHWQRVARDYEAKYINISSKLQKLESSAGENNASHWQRVARDYEAKYINISSKLQKLESSAGDIRSEINMAQVNENNLMRGKLATIKDVVRDWDVSGIESSVAMLKIHTVLYPDVPKEEPKNV